MNDLHVYDTTLRDGAQQEGLTLSVADKLAIAAPPRRARGRLHRGWLAGRQPQGHRVLRPGPRRAAAAPRHARRVRRDPPPGALAADGPAGAARCSTSRRPGRHARRQEPPAARRARRCARRRGEPGDGPRHRRASCGPRGGACSSTPSTSSTASSPTAPTRSRCCGPRPRRAPRWSPCATPTAGCSRRRSRDVVAGRRRRDRGAPGHPLPQRHRLRRRQLAGRGRRRRQPRAGHPQRLRRADRQRRPA